MEGVVSSQSSQGCVSRSKVYLIAVLVLLLALSEQQEGLQPVYDFLPWSLDLWNDTNYVLLTRFEKHEVLTLATELRLHEVVYPYRLAPPPEVALTLVLARLSFPGRWRTLCESFGRSETTLSRVFNAAVTTLVHRYRSTLSWHPQLNDYARLETFAKSIDLAGAGAQCLWGFIDGTFLRSCRPSAKQRPCYSGHNRGHGLKFQAIVTPDGLVSSLIGPFEGSVNDWGMWNVSGVEERLRVVFEGRQAFYLYGDPAYRPSFGVISPFGHHLGRQELPPIERSFNARMAGLRISVEHAFGEVARLWTYTQFGKQLKLGNQAMASFYMAAVLLTNCRVCLREGNQTSSKYRCQPPTLAEYLRPPEPGNEVDTGLSDGQSPSESLGDSP